MLENMLSRIQVALAPVTSEDQEQILAKLASKWVDTKRKCIEMISFAFVDLRKTFLDVFLYRNYDVLLLFGRCRLCHVFLVCLLGACHD